jgi:hypothetical protein
MDAPWQTCGPSFEKGRKEFIVALENSENYPLDVITKCVDKYIEEEIDKNERYPFGSDHGFAISFDATLEEIKKLILKSSSRVENK